MFHGSLVAIVTPFDSKGRIETRILEQLVEWHISQGTDGLVCSGATGESTCLTLRDRKKLIEICVRVAQKRIPILAGTGTPNTKETIQLTEQAQRLGADGCLVITPYYNKPTQRGIVLHYRQVAQVGLPIIAYHNPGRTNVKLTVGTLAEMGTIPGIVAVKEASGDLEFQAQVREATPLPILSGEDWLTFETIRRGGVGSISTIGNIIPGIWKEMIRLSLKGELEKGKKIADRFEPFCRALCSETNPQCVKYVLSLMGKCHPFLRMPLVMPLPETQSLLKRTLLHLALPFAKSLKPTRVVC